MPEFAAIATGSSFCITITPSSNFASFVTFLRVTIEAAAQPRSLPVGSFSHLRVMIEAAV